MQSSIRIGRVLFPRQHPDFVGMQVVATILGGYFGSRLVQNLCEKRGYTYGVMAAMVNLREAGYLAISTEVAAEATDDAIEQVLGEIELLRTELVGADELENVRRSMLGEVMRILDGPFGIVDVVIENVQIGAYSTDTRLDDSRPVDHDSTGVFDAAGESNYLADFVAQVEAITPERIRDLARKYLSRDQFTVVVVGPATTVTDGNMKT